MSYVRKTYWDSLRENPVYNSLQQNIRRLVSKSDNYGAFVLYTSFYSADFAKFNADNTTSQFGPLSAPAAGIGYGFSFKKNRRIFDLNITTFGFNKKTKNDKGTISASFLTAMQLEWGYDLIKSNRLNFYPYAGIGMRSSSISFKGKGQTNPAYTNISNIQQNDNSADKSFNELGYQAGLGIEIVLSKKDQPGGTLFFAKGGTNRAFSDKAFYFGDIKYDPKFNYGDVIISAGFKFFGRR